MKSVKLEPQTDSWSNSTMSSFVQHCESESHTVTLFRSLIQAVGQGCQTHLRLRARLEKSVQNWHKFFSFVCLFLIVIITIFSRVWILFWDRTVVGLSLSWINKYDTEAASRWQQFSVLTSDPLTRSFQTTDSFRN